MDELGNQNDRDLLRYLLNGRPRRARQRPARRLTGTAAIFVEYFTTHGDYFESRDAHAIARQWAVRWAKAYKADRDAAEFLRLGGRPTELAVLVEWDDMRLDRRALTRHITRHGEDLGTVLEVLRAREMTISEVVALYHRTGT